METKTMVKAPPGNMKMNMNMNRDQAVFMTSRDQRLTGTTGTLGKCMRTISPGPEKFAIQRYLVYRANV